MKLDRRSFLLAAAGAAGSSTLGLGSKANATPKSKEGYARLEKGRVWWRIVGASTRTPLLTLHGGPGAGSIYLEPLSRLADQRRVIFYDQLGCGRSDAPDDPSIYTIDYFVDEIDRLRHALGIKEFILYGHSWGGWLAQEYMAQRGNDGSDVKALILASTSASTKQAVDGMHQLLARLPGDMNAERIRLEESGKQDLPEYEKLTEKFYDAYLFHSDGPPSRLFTQALNNVEHSRTYPLMNGPNEFSIVGTLKDWDREKDLSRIRVPTLIMASEWDEATSDCIETLHQGITGSEVAIIPGAHHLAMIEKPAAYDAVLRKYLSRFA